jgi:hypothetical protein
MSDVPPESSQAGEWAVLDLLVHAEGHPLLSLAEIEREVGSHLRAVDAVDALHRAGLVHRTSDGFVFATRAAVHHGRFEF